MWRDFSCLLMAVSSVNSLQNLKPIAKNLVVCVLVRIKLGGGGFHFGEVISFFFHERRPFLGPWMNCRYFSCYVWCVFYSFTSPFPSFLFSLSIGQIRAVTFSKLEVVVVVCFPSKNRKKISRKSTFSIKVCCCKYVTAAAVATTEYAAVPCSFSYARASFLFVAISVDHNYKIY